MSNITIAGFDPEQFISSLQGELSILLAQLGSILVLVSLVGLIYLLIDYILRSLALARIGHRRGIPLWGLAWVPGLRLIVLGGIADDHDRKTVKRRHGFNLLLPILLFISLAAVLINIFMLRAQINTAAQIIAADPNRALEAVTSLSGGKVRILLAVIASLASSLLVIFKYIAIYKLLESCKKKHTFLNMILYLALPLAAPFVLIAVSGSDSDKKKKKHQPREEVEIEAETEEL